MAPGEYSSQKKKKKKKKTLVIMKVWDTQIIHCRGHAKTGDSSSLRQNPVYLDLKLGLVSLFDGTPTFLGYFMPKPSF